MDKNVGVIEDYKMLEKGGGVRVEGRAVDKHIGSGNAKVLTTIVEMSSLSEGDILIADITDPDWEPIMKKARLEFVIRNTIGVHLKALPNCDTLDAVTEAIMDKRMLGFVFRRPVEELRALPAAVVEELRALPRTFARVPVEELRALPAAVVEELRALPRIFAGAPSVAKNIIKASVVHAA